jgi:CheY-like chemotaxis protein
MTAPVLTLPLSSAIASPVKKKRVLLVDSSPAKRDLRAEIMRKLGMEVDCAADISEARCWWRADLYDLVLINIGNELGPRNKFCEDIRGATPPQQLAFLVGKPEYLAESPNNEDGAPSIQKHGGPAHLPDVGVAVSADISGGLPQRWGILEACRRISAVRCVADARSRAVRERPAPPRDLEARYSKRTESESQVLPELLREEMQ